MKNIHLIIYGLILILSILCLLTIQKRDRKDDSNIYVVYSPSNNNTLKINCVEDFDQIVNDLQPNYRLGYNGTYEPAPICSQPLDALPFNPGLKPCNEIIPV